MTTDWAKSYIHVFRDCSVIARLERHCAWQWMKSKTTRTSVRLHHYLYFYAHGKYGDGQSEQFAYQSAYGIAESGLHVWTTQLGESDHVSEVDQYGCAACFLNLNICTQSVSEVQDRSRAEVRLRCWCQIFHQILCTRLQSRSRVNIRCRQVTTRQKSEIIRLSTSMPTSIWSTHVSSLWWSWMLGRARRTTSWHPTTLSTKECWDSDWVGTSSTKDNPSTGLLLQLQQ